ncbi:MAG: aspartyl protease family protein [Weeksellaceae bacterium]|nr:aspartyl protease family protein [Weeksellaceae bacterium]
MFVHRIVLSVMYVLLGFSIGAQNLSIEKNKNKFRLKFEQASGFVILPVSVNGSQPLNFLLDTGSPYTIITHLDAFKYLQLKKGEPINIWGLGRDREKLEAYLSKNNTLGFGKAHIDSADVILLYENENLGSRFGMQVYGIIGYDLFKDLVVRIDYVRENITFYQHSFFYKKFNTSAYTDIDMQISGKKPYLQLNAVINENTVPLRLLIDSAGSDPLWLFENEDIYPDEPYIEDYLGFGLNGEILGKRSRIQSLNIGNDKLEQPTVSFPDSLSVSYVTRTERSGSLGAEILRRYTTIYDYRNSKLFLKKNRHLGEKFYYNLAGLELNQPFPELPYLEVFYVRENSPAYKAGLRKGDVVRYVNNKKIGLYHYKPHNDEQTAAKIEKINFGYSERELISLVEIIEMFRKKPGSQIEIVYTRGDSQVERIAEFVLESSF